MISLETSIRVWGIRDILFALSRSALRNSASQANHDSPLQSIRINLLGTRKKPCIPKWLAVLEDLLHVREKQFGPQQQQRFVRGRAMLQRHLSGVAGKKFPRERSERWLSEGLGKRKTTKTIKNPWNAWGHIKKCSIQHHSANLPRSSFFIFCLDHCSNCSFIFLSTDLCQDNDDYWMAFGSGDITICFPGVEC